MSKVYPKTMLKLFIGFTKPLIKVMLLLNSVSV